MGVIRQKTSPALLVRLLGRILEELIRLCGNIKTVPAAVLGWTGMGQPEDSVALVKDQPEGFDAKAYLTEFGMYRWTYVVGLKEILRTSLLRNLFPTLRAAQRMVEAQTAVAPSRISDGWKKPLATGHWHDCGPAQFQDAWNGRPLRFDKACLVIKALELALARQDQTGRLGDLDIYQFVRLVPAVFVLRNLEEWQFLMRYPHRMKEYENDFLAALKQKLPPMQRSTPEGRIHGPGHLFLSHAIKGFGITWRNAVIIRDSFEQELSVPAEIQMLTNRSDGGLKTNMKKCNEREGPFVGLTKQQLDELTAACRILRSA
jgi:hypothetical protein